MNPFFFSPAHRQYSSYCFVWLKYKKKWIKKRSEQNQKKKYENGCCNSFSNKYGNCRFVVVFISNMYKTDFIVILSRGWILPLCISYLPLCVFRFYRIYLLNIHKTEYDAERKEEKKRKIEEIFRCQSQLQIYKSANVYVITCMTNG